MVDAFLFAFDDEADGGALHPTCRQPAVHPAPQHRRHLIAVQAVENAAGLGSVNEALIDLAWVVDGVLNGGGGDLVEHHATHRHLRPQTLHQVP